MCNLKAMKTNIEIISIKALCNKTKKGFKLKMVAYDLKALVKKRNHQIKKKKKKRKRNTHSLI